MMLRNSKDALNHLRIVHANLDVRLLPETRILVNAVSFGEDRPDPIERWFSRYLSIRVEILDDCTVKAAKIQIFAT